MRVLRKHRDERKQAFHRWEIRVKAEARTQKRKESPEFKEQIGQNIQPVDKKEGCE